MRAAAYAAAIIATAKSLNSLARCLSQNRLTNKPRRIGSRETADCQAVGRCRRYFHRYFAKIFVGAQTTWVG
jgi:hypothetical protein